MLLKIQIKFVIVTLSSLMFCVPVYSGETFNCESVQSGNWDNPATWTGCDGGYPNSADEGVLIKAGHEVELNIENLIIYGFHMESNSVLSIGMSNDFYTLTTESADFNTGLGSIVSGSYLEFIASNGNVILGAVENIGVNRSLKVQASQDVIIEDTDLGFNSFRFTAESVNPVGRIIVKEDITTMTSQNYNSELEITRSVKFSGGAIQVSEGLVLGIHSLELDMGGSILGAVTASASDLIKSGAFTLELNTPIPAEITTYVNGGELVINDIHHGEVTLSSDSRLAGSGEISSSLTMNDMSVLSPTVNFKVNDLIMTADSEFDTGAGHLLTVLGAVNLDGTLLFSIGYPYGYGEVITLIDNQGNNPVNGIFQGFNEGDVITENFQISYQGGDGNDVTITSVCGESITVTNNLDNGPGSFRAAVANVCEGGSIDFQDSFVITVDSTIEIDNGSNFLTINGSDQTFQSSGSHSIINIVDGSYVRLFGATFQNSTTTAGAITVNGYLVLGDTYLSNNLNTSMFGGGAISVYGGIAIYSSSFYQNNANQGGAIYNNDGAVYVRNSTFYQNGNLITNQGGTIYNNKQLELVNVTLVDSGDGSMVEGNSIYNVAIPNYIKLINTVISNFKPSVSECFGPSKNNSSILNTLIEDGSCNAPLSGEPMLGNWGDNGGVTLTIPILSGSPLINAGDELYCSGLSFNFYDQIGNPRTYGVSCDIGAIEYIDVTPPEVLAVKVSDDPIDVCGVVSNQTNQFNVTFNEPMLNAQDSDNYQFIHAGDDQSFLTSDDVVIDVIAAESDNLRPNPTVTMITSEPVPNGLLRLQIDSDITDEFYLDLYDGDGYQHPFRVDIGNHYVGGHFDDCVEQDPLALWSINTNNAVTLGPDKDNSNVSLSLLAEVSDNDDLIVNQCVNLDEVTALSMSVFIKDSPIVAVENKIGEHKQGQSFNLMMSCNLFDDENCFGNQLDVIETQNTNLNSSLEWQAIEFDLGLIDVATKSGSCGLALFANQASASQVQLDALRLVVVSDLIYSHGFESLSD